MPQENWLAVRGGEGWNPADGLLAYGWKTDGAKTVPFTGGITDLYAARRPPKGSIAFYVLHAGPWVFILDPEGVLWETLATHRAVSKQISGTVAVVVAKASSQSMGYGLFERGRISRWIFMQADTVAQTYGKAPPWEPDVLSTPAEIGARLRQRLGISLEGVREATVLFAPVPGEMGELPTRATRVRPRRPFRFSLVRRFSSRLRNWVGR